MPLIYLDACLLIYLVEQDPVFSDRVAEAIGRHADEAVDLLRDQLISAITAEFRDGQLPFEALYPMVMIIRRLYPKVGSG